MAGIFPTLNWRELSALAEKIRPEAEGLFVDRIIIPERARFPQGYVKGEWAIRLTGRRNEAVLLVSVRARRPYITWIDGKGPKASAKGTHSPFDLAVSKQLKGAKLTKLETLPRERTLILWFAAEGSRERLGLALVLIPSVPEALLVREREGASPRQWDVLFRTRNIKENAPYLVPDGNKAPAEMAVREELVATQQAFTRAIEAALELEAFELRVKALERSLKEVLKQAHDRIRQNEVAIAEGKAESDWQRWGELLKGSLGFSGGFSGGSSGDSSEGRTGTGHSSGKSFFREAQDFETGEIVRIPSDPKLSAQAQVEKFYQLARRKARRIEQASERLKTVRETAAKFERILESLPSSLDWPALEKIERALGAQLGAAPTGATGSPGKDSRKSKSSWMGKACISKDGLPIWIGRSRDENLELTFKHTKGNDLWMHVRGRPGAHVVIPLSHGKSAPLDTLLDAAALCVFYSGGEKWGKTEVDYTFKKYVKRIKDSTEASYVNNKTLIVEPDPVRLKRLLDGGG